MNRPPAFQFYPREWFDFRVQRMSLEAQGAYIKLLCYMWNDSDDQCSLLDNDECLARAVGTTVEHWRKLRNEIQWESDPILNEKHGRLLSSRLRDAAASQRKYRKAQSDKGKRSAEQRFNRGSTAVQPKPQPETHSSSSSSLHSYRERKRSPTVNGLNGHRSSFEVFWQAYPKKEGKGACRNWWGRNAPDEMLLHIMLTKIEQAKQTKKWQDEDGKFIPMPATWLNQERWDDEYTQVTMEKEPIPL